MFLLPFTPTKSMRGEMWRERDGEKKVREIIHESYDVIRRANALTNSYFVHATYSAHREREEEKKRLRLRQ